MDVRRIVLGTFELDDSITNLMLQVRHLGAMDSDYWSTLQLFDTFDGQSQIAFTIDNGAMWRLVGSFDENPDALSIFFGMDNQYTFSDLAIGELAGEIFAFNSKGQTSSFGSFAGRVSVPEPTSVAVLYLGFLLVMPRRRRV